MDLEDTVLIRLRKTNSTQSHLYVEKVELIETEWNVEW